MRRIYPRRRVPPIPNNPLASRRAIVPLSQTRCPRGSRPNRQRAASAPIADRLATRKVFLGVSLPREIDFLFLVLIAGALGAFLHSARSFTAFAGEGTLKSSWMWWYWLHPFLGAALALAFYLAVRGGFLVVATGAVKTSDLSPFAIVALG